MFFTVMYYMHVVKGETLHKTTKEMFPALLSPLSIEE